MAEGRSYRSPLTRSARGTRQMYSRDFRCPRQRAMDSTLRSGRVTVSFREGAFERSKVIRFQKFRRKRTEKRATVQHKMVENKMRGHRTVYGPQSSCARFSRFFHKIRFTSRTVRTISTTFWPKDLVYSEMFGFF